MNPQERIEHEKVLNAKHCRDYYWRNREAILLAKKEARHHKLQEEGGEQKKLGRPRTRIDPPESLKRGRPRKEKLQDAEKSS